MGSTAYEAAQAAPRATVPGRGAGGELGYRPQLDALRAFAVAGVLYSHFSRQPHVLNYWTGNWGVRLFFVLSGFLITGILLRARDDAPNAGGVGRQFRVFYARRFLRIFPLYYATLAVGWLAKIPNVRAEIRWDLLYLNNVYVAYRGKFPPWTAHLWSLSVEEQFYLVWPALVLLLPRRFLGPAIVAGIVVGPLSRWSLLAMGFSSLAPWTLTPAMLDSLGMGALLAWSQWRTGSDPGAVPGWLRVAVLPAFAGFVLLHQLASILPNAWLFQDTLAALVYAWLVARAARGFGGPVGAVLSWRPLTYLGQISYGIYILHFFMWYACWWMLYYAHVEPGELGRAMVYTTATVVVASLSWHFFERPINDLKRFFPYRRRAPTTPMAADPGVVGVSTPAL
jgi:peptidoglycan/LPS O-acetylase OafA/YrhL